MKKSIEEIKSDYHLFADIQISKYLSRKNKSAFSDDKEAEFVVEEILNTYNEKIASDHLRLNNLNQASKVSWFNSIEIDFEELNITDLPDDNIPELDIFTKELISSFDDIFYFLPEGAIIYLLHAGPALEAYGYLLERFNKITEGEEPTEIEEDLLNWAYDLVFEIHLAYFEKNKNKKDDFLANAMIIAEEELDKKTASDVVAKIYVNIKEFFAEFEEKKDQLKKKKKKRKK